MLYLHMYVYVRIYIIDANRNRKQVSVIKLMKGGVDSKFLFELIFVDAAFVNIINEILFSCTTLALVT